jgi:hypothetical protein
MAFKPQKFAFRAEDLATELPVLPEKAYAGILHLSVERSVGDTKVSTIAVNPVTKWDEGTKTYIPTGEYKLSGSLSYGVELTSKLAISILKQSKPRINARFVDIVFDQETGAFDKAANPVISKLTNMFLADGENDVFAEILDDVFEQKRKPGTEELVHVDVPEELSEIPNIQDLCDAADYYDAVFREWVLRLDGVKVRAMVTKECPQVNVDGKWTKGTKYVNRLNQGRNAPFENTGLLPYIEQSEFDMED